MCKRAQALAALECTSESAGAPFCSMGGTRAPLTYTTQPVPESVVQAGGKGSWCMRRFKGVGPKTVACVMMFCLARDEFPVDTHVWRISKNMGWVPAKANRDDTYRHMNIRVPADIRWDTHDPHSPHATTMQLMSPTPTHAWCEDI